MTYELLRELRRQGDLVEGDTVLVEVHPDVAQVLASTDRPFLEEMEKRLQKRIVVKARGSFHVEDFEIRSPNDKAPIEKSEVAAAAATTRTARATASGAAGAGAISVRRPRSRPRWPRKKRAPWIQRRSLTRRRRSATARSRAKPRRPTAAGPGGGDKARGDGDGADARRFRALGQHAPAGSRRFGRLVLLTSDL